MKKKKKTKKLKYEFAIESLPKPLIIILFSLSILLIIGGVLFFIPINIFEFFEPFVVFIFAGIYISLIIPASIILFISRRPFIFILKSNTLLEQNCILCLSEINNNEHYVRCPFCNKPMHFSELTDWLEINSLCPNCKRKLSRVSFK